MKHKIIIIPIALSSLLAVLLLGACQKANRASPAFDASAHKNEIQKWQSARLASLTKEDGWLTLTGLFWLNEGENKFGSDAKNIVVLPHEREKIIAANGDESAFRWLPRQKFYVIEKQDGMPCQFLTQYNRCGIYELRPLDCRTWPLTYSPKDGTFYADTECPAVKLGVTAKFLDYVVRLIRVNR